MPRGKINDTTSAGGIGESRVFRNPEAQQPEVFSCHIGGRLVADLLESGELLQPPLYALTDEGIEERTAAAIARGAKEIRTSLVRDSEEKKLDQFEGMLRDDIRHGGAIDPFRAAMDRHVPQGMSGCFLNDTASKFMTTHEYEPVLVDGKRVMVGDSWLGVKPTAVVEAEHKYYRDLEREKAESYSDAAWRQKQRQMYQDEGAAIPKFLRDDRIDHADPGITEDSM